MLIAKNIKSELITANENLDLFSAGATYFCPNEFCESRILILKKGSCKIPHFAHKNNNHCWEPEPESGSHLLMKKTLQILLNIPNKFIEYRKIKGVIPDLLYKEKYAIEVQYSPILVTEIERRNQIYRNNNLVPIWIFYYSPYHKGNYLHLAIKSYRDTIELNRFRLTESEQFILKEQGFLLYFIEKKNYISNIVFTKFYFDHSLKSIGKISKYFCLYKGTNYFNKFWENPSLCKEIDDLVGDLQIDSSRMRLFSTIFLTNDFYNLYNDLKCKII